MRLIHRLTALLPDSATVAARFRPVWSGVLVMDGKVVRVFDPLSAKLGAHAFSAQERHALHKRRWLCGVDYGSGDLPHYTLADEETMIDLVLYFRTLKEIGYSLRVLVCDGNPDIVRAARKVYGGGFLVQLCTRHFIEGLKRKAAEGCAHDDPRTIFLISLIQQVIEANDVEEAGRRLDRLKQQPRHLRIHRLLMADFMAHADELTTHLQRPDIDIPHTTNDIETLFRQLMLRLRPLGRFMSHRSAHNYLNAWALLRRFTPFTDCRGGRRARNRKAPLALAGCAIENIDPLRLRRGT